MAAWVELVEKLGSRSIAELLEPAIYYAESGFPLFPQLAHVFRATEKSPRFHASVHYYPNAGESDDMHLPQRGPNIVCHRR